MMQSPTVDIIIPVWNSPYETRECLSAIRTCSPEARLIVVDNGSNRETELMLEEFSEALDDKALFLKSDRNVGLVKAINIGLALSDSDFVVIIRPHVLVTSGWLDELIDAAKFGISSPTFYGTNSPKLPKPSKGISQMETFNLSFSAVALKCGMRQMIGNFDEDLDGAEWCLADYIMRAAGKGFRVFVSKASRVRKGTEAIFGSEERLASIASKSREICLNRWGVRKQYAVYFGRILGNDEMAACMDTIMKAARLGHHFTLLLHKKQYGTFLRMGWNYWHTSIALRTVSSLFSRRDLKRQITDILMKSPETVLVEASYGSLNSTVKGAVSFEEIVRLSSKQFEQIS